jgi:hypothetical protein
MELGSCYLDPGNSISVSRRQRHRESRCLAAEVTSMRNESIQRSCQIIKLEL